MNDQAQPPRLTETQIQALTDPGSFQRGQGYYRQGNIISPRREGHTLIAECWGSQTTPYRIKLTLGEGGAVTGNCSCPIGAGGRCKHAVALLLTWLHEPEGFTEKTSLAASLEDLDRDALIDLVNKMMMRYPDLETLVMLKRMSDPAQAGEIDAETIQTQARQAINSLNDSNRTIYHVVEDLDEILALGETYMQQEAWRNAVTLYTTVSQVVCNASRYIQDETGELFGVLWDCVTGLRPCLTSVQDTALREEILRALFDIYVWDVGMGGYGISDEVPVILLDETTPEEQTWVAGWVRETIAQERDEHPASTGWRREILGGLLLMLEADQMDDEQFIRTCRDTGRHHDLITRLLELGRVSDALTEARQVKDYQLRQLADIFVTYEYGDEVRDLIEERASESNDSRLKTWLQDYAEKEGDLDRALQIAEERFWERPYLDRYQEVARLSEKLGNWTERREKILAQLAAQDEDRLIVEIYLDEGDVPAMLDAYKILEEKAKARSNRWGPYISLSSLQIKIANAIEEAHPWQAIAFRMPTVNNLIAARGRDNYAKAAAHLTRVRDLCLAQKRPERWDDLITAIKEENSNLPAFQDELRKAGL